MVKAVWGFLVLDMTKFTIQCILCPAKWECKSKDKIITNRHLIEFICRDCWRKHGFDF